MLEKLPVAAYACNPSGLITFYNQQAVRLWGRAPKLNDPVDRFCGSFKLFSPSGTPIAHDQCWMALALRTGKEYNGEEVVIERPDGTRVTVLAHISATHDDSGQGHGAVNVLVDITERKRIEEANRRLAAIIESSGDAIISKTLDSLIVNWNRGAERIYGYTAEEVRGRSIALLIPPTRTGEELDIQARLLRGEAIAQYETTRLRKDGTLIDVSLTISPIKDGEGRITGVSIVAREITERVRLQAERDRLAERQRLQIERLPLAYILIGPDDRILDWNPAAQKVFGYSKTEAVGQGSIDLIVPPGATDQVKGIVRRLQAGDTEAHSINQNRTKDGRVILCSWFNTPFMEPDGSFGGILALARDITAEKQAEKRLRETQEWFSQLATNIDGYFWLNAPDDSQMYYMSPGYEKITGHTCASLYQRPESWTELIHPDDRERILAVVQEPYNDGPRQMEYRIERPDGSVRWIRDRAFPVRNETGQVYRIAGIGEDITERKKAEEKLRDYHERVQALSRQLLIAHEEERRHLARELHDEIGQVLTAIHYNLDLVKTESTSAAHSRLDDCIGVVNRAIEQVRNLSLDLRPSILDDSGLKAALEWYADRLAQRTGLVVNLNAPSGSLLLPHDLRTACFRVAQEALTNVVRHAAAKQVWLEIKLGEGMVNLVIRDDGKGFDVIAVEKRVARERRIGLEGIRERIGLLGGTFMLDSAPGEGTTIRVVLPLPLLQDDEAEGNK
jgi:PAS domain S-box-containing protein